jgi:hypothetical protein
MPRNIIMYPSENLCICLRMILQTYYFLGSADADNLKVLFLTMPHILRALVPCQHTKLVFLRISKSVLCPPIRRKQDHAQVPKFDSLA